MTPQGYLTVRDMARKLGCSKAQVFKLLNQYAEKQELCVRLGDKSQPAFILLPIDLFNGYLPQKKRQAAGRLGGLAKQGWRKPKQKRKVVSA